MIHPTVDIHTYLKPGVRVHLAGIGGVSMCPLAEVLRGIWNSPVQCDIRKRRLCSPSGRNVHPENERFDAFFHFPICQMVCFYKWCKVGIKR